MILSISFFACWDTSRPSSPHMQISWWYTSTSWKQSCQKNQLWLCVIFFHTYLTMNFYFQSSNFFFFCFLLKIYQQNRSFLSETNQKALCCCFFLFAAICVKIGKTFQFFYWYSILFYIPYIQMCINHTQLSLSLSLSVHILYFISEYMFKSTHILYSSNCLCVIAQYTNYICSFALFPYIGSTQKIFFLKSH